MAVHQDYAWFAALLFWSLALVVWRWHPQRRDAWAWLPLPAVAGVLSAVVQFGIYSPPFDFFHDRLIPGTLSGYTTAVVGVDLLGDLLLGWLAAAVAATGWLLQPGRLRVPALGVVFLGAILYPLAPAWGATLLVAASLAALAASWRSAVSSPPARVALVFAALVPLFSTVGPLAAATGMLQRSGPPTPLGLLAAIVQSAAAIAALGGLLRGTLRSTGLGSVGMLWRQAWPLLLVAALWLVAGLVFAHQTGEDNRAELLQNRLRGTAVRAMNLDLSGLAQLARNNYGLARNKFVEAGLQHSPLLATTAGEELHRQMLREHNSTVYTDRARLVVLHDGWLMAVASSNPRQPPGVVELIRRATPDDAADWAGHRNVIESSPVAEVGQPYYTRAALVGHDDRMLGWLEFSRGEFFQSLERKWRTGPLLVTALGLVLGAQAWLQRRGQREREAALRAAAVAAEASRLKTDFLAKVSHELRTPLQSLLGYGELLQGRLGDDTQARAWLGALQRHGGIMTRLVNDLLDLSAAESGAFRLTPRPVAPGALIREMAESLAPRAAAKGLQLRCTVTPAVPAWVEADGNRLGQIALNLAGNAIKFTDAGEVSLALDATAPADGRVQLILAVRDTGPGIKPADQATLFEPFARLAPTADREGSGLGLALSRTLCRAMGGDLTVESDGRHGSCFRATLSVPVVPAPAESTPAGTRVGIRPTAVLVVEDNTLVRDLFVSFLSGQGCVCVIARTGAEALASLHEQRPEAIILDLSLPDGDGIALLPQLRAGAPGARIVAVSAHANEADRARALAAGVAAFFTKPVALEHLWAAVTGGRTARAPAAPPSADQLLAIFQRELPGLRAELAAALAAGDMLRVRRRAHYLANSALVLGARDLLDACLALERTAERGGDGAVAEAWRRCDALISNLLSHVV